MSPLTRTALGVILAASLTVFATATHAAPVIGFIEHWNSPPSISTWSSQANLSNPGAGGVGGAADGYLRVARPSAAQLGAFSSGIEFIGDWVGANVNRIRLSLNDVETNQGLEIHVSVGNGGNFWQYKTGFTPPENGWAQFTVDLTDSTQFTHIIAIDGKGFAHAMQNADRVLVRHDLFPYTQAPDNLAGEFGLDDFELTNSLLDTGPPGGAVAGRPVELAPPYPNPAVGAVTFRFESFDAGPVRILVFDAAGRLVRSDVEPAATPGRRIWTWNGRDDNGRQTPAGSYRVRMTGANGGTTRPFVRLAP